MLKTISSFKLLVEIEDVDTILDWMSQHEVMCTKIRESKSQRMYECFGDHDDVVDFLNKIARSKEIRASMCWISR